MIMLLLSLKSLPPPLFSFLFASYHLWTTFHISLLCISGVKWTDWEYLNTRRWKDLGSGRQLCGPCAFEMIQRRRALISSIGTATAVKRLVTSSAASFFPLSKLHPYLLAIVFFSYNCFILASYLYEINRYFLKIIELSLPIFSS